jgi:hypothetical protein
MDKYLSKQQIKVILEQAPKGTDGGKIVDGLVSRGYKLEGFNDQPEPVKPDGFVKTIVKDAVGTLVVKPAARTAEAIGRTGILGTDIKKGYEAMADENQTQNFGGIEVEQQKAFGDGGARQITSDTLKIGSYLFPYGRVAKGVGAGVLGTSKLTPQAVSTAKITGNVASGLSGGYLTDAGNNLADESQTVEEAITPGATTLLGGAIPLAIPALSKGVKAVKSLKNVPTNEDTIGKIIQGQTDDIPLAQKALSSIDTTGVKTREELAVKLKDAMTKQMGIVDTELAKDPRLVSLDNFAIRQTNKAGQEVKTDFISEAFTNLDELYQSTGDDLSRSNLNLLKDKAVKEGLTHQEVNNIARMYSEEFGAKAFNKIGDPLTSVNAQKFENVRTGLKQAARGGLGFGKEAAQADRLYYAMENTNKLINKGIEGVNKLQQRVKERTFLEKGGRTVMNVINTLSGGFLKGAASSVFPSNVGLKTLNWLDLEKSLSKDLEFINKANSIKDDSALLKFLQEKSKGIKFPGDKAVEDISKRVNRK